MISPVDLPLEVPHGAAKLDDGAHIEVVPADGDYAQAIVRRGPDGSMTWQVLPPEGGQDVWVSARLQEDALVANSWSGWLVRLDLVTGVVIERIFTK